MDARMASWLRPRSRSRLSSRARLVCTAAGCLAGTRYPVMEIAVHYNAGDTPEEIAADYGLDLSHVYAGIAYYLANREAVERDLAEDQALYDAGVAAAERESHGE